MGTALKRHKLSIDVIVTLHVNHKIQQINTSNKILQKDVTMYLFCCNQFFFLFSIYYSSHSSSSISFPNFAPDIFSSLQLNYSVKT